MFHLNVPPFRTFSIIFEHLVNIVQIGLNFQNPDNFVCFFLISHCKTCVGSKFRAYGTMFNHLLRNKKILKYQLDPRAKFFNLGQFFFYFFLFHIVKPAFCPKFVFMQPFFAILLRKTQNCKNRKQKRVKNLQISQLFITGPLGPYTNYHKNI